MSATRAQTDFSTDVPAAGFVERRRPGRRDYTNPELIRLLRLPTEPSPAPPAPEPVLAPKPQTPASPPGPSALRTVLVLLWMILVWGAAITLVVTSFGGSGQTAHSPATHHTA